MFSEFLNPSPVAALIMTDNLKLIDMINGGNYTVWKIRMQALIVSKS